MTNKEKAEWILANTSDDPCWNLPLDMKPLREIVQAYLDLLDAIGLDEHWESNVKVARKSGIERIITSMPVDKYEQIGKLTDTTQ